MLRMVGCFLVSAPVTVVIVTRNKVANKNAASGPLAALICDKHCSLTAPVQCL